MITNDEFSIVFFLLSGFQVQVIVWNARDLTSIGDYVLHHAEVAAVAISPNDKYVVSAGGKDDPSVLVWDIATRTPLCGALDI